MVHYPAQLYQIVAENSYALRRARFTAPHRHLLLQHVGVDAQPRTGAPQALAHDHGACPRDGEDPEVNIHLEPPTAALEGRRSRLYVHVDVVEDLTAAGRAASGSVSSRRYRSVQGYEWRLGEPDSGMPEKERRSSTTKYCKDGRRDDRGGDRDRDRDGDGRRDRNDGREHGKERRGGAARSGRADPYPVRRHDDRRSVHDGRRHAGGPIRRRVSVFGVALARRQTALLSGGARHALLRSLGDVAPLHRRLPLLHRRAPC